MPRSTTPSEDLPVEELRAASRRLVRELGLLRPAAAGAGLGPSGVQAVLEIGRDPGVQARDLAGRLRLDKSNASRRVAQLEAAGLVRREPDPDDARSSRLHLTDAGQALRGEVERGAAEQAARVLGHMEPADRRELIRCLMLYVDALRRVNQGG